MKNLPIWLPRLAGNKGPRFLQIADALQAAVADGSLTPGDRLPPQRQLAAQLDVDLTTITRAYDEARRRNLLEGRGARCTYVAAPKVELTSILDLSMNSPPPPDGVDFDDMLKQGLSQVLMRADNEALMTYHLGGGSDSDRKAGAKWLEPMFGHLDSREVVVCPGAQAAIAALILGLDQRLPVGRHRRRRQAPGDRKIEYLEQLRRREAPRRPAIHIPESVPIWRRRCG
jgi:DNA-binding transcriptional MocR family regulator